MHWHCTLEWWQFMIYRWSKMPPIHSAGVHKHISHTLIWHFFLESWFHSVKTTIWHTCGRKWLGKIFQRSDNKQKKHKNSVWKFTDTREQGGCVLHKPIWERLNVYTPVSFLFSEPWNFWSSLVLESIWGLSFGAQTGGQFSSVLSSQMAGDAVEERRLVLTAWPCWALGGALCCWAIAVRTQLSHCCLW